MKNKISIVIPLKSESKNNNIELLYALRSLESNLKGFGDIFIIGDKIYSLKGLKFIPGRDEKGSRWKERNIYRKILSACACPEVTEDFVFMNDDHFINFKGYANDIPFFHKHNLEETMARNVGNDYRKSLNHTRKILIAAGKPTLDFDTHCPIIYNKHKFLSTFVNTNWNLEYGYVIKSLYAGLNDIEGEVAGDCKIQVKSTYDDILQKIEGKKFFSTSDGSVNEDMIKVLNKLYPNKSVYEK